MRSGTSGSKFKANRSSWLGGLFNRRKACHDDARHGAASDDNLPHNKSGGEAGALARCGKALAEDAGAAALRRHQGSHRAKLSNTLNIIRPGQANAARVVSAGGAGNAAMPALPTLAPLNMKKSALQLRRERRRAAADKTQSWAGSTAHTAASADRDRSSSSGEASLPAAGFALGNPRASSLHRRRSLKQAGNLQSTWSGDTCLDLSKAESPLWGFGGFVLPAPAPAPAASVAADASGAAGPGASPRAAGVAGASGAREDNSDLTGFSLRFDSLLSPMPPVSPVADFQSLMSPVSPTSCSSEAVDHLGGFAAVHQTASCC